MRQCEESRDGPPAVDEDVITSGLGDHHPLHTRVGDYRPPTEGVLGFGTSRLRARSRRSRASRTSSRSRASSAGPETTRFQINKRPAGDQSGPIHEPVPKRQRTEPPDAEPTPIKTNKRPPSPASDDSGPSAKRPRTLAPGVSAFDYVSKNLL